MVAVRKDLGPIAQNPLYAMRNTWDVRSGRGHKHAVWQDELNDAMASIGLDASCITEEPPQPPVGSSLCAYSHNLWVNAVLQYQDEGTKLFDIVRPSLLISTDYAQMDLRAISEMKRGQVKDGRALLRWAMSFVDYSSLSNQIKLMEEMNEKKIEVNATKLQLSTHMISLLELWLQKEGADINKPAEYFQRLLMSMPTQPEGALVRVRSKIADMINENSVILRNLDGENGFFARISKYAESQGVKDEDVRGPKVPGFRPLGGLHAIQVEAEQCKECYSWICKKMAEDCICKHDSTFDINKITPGLKKDFVVLNREYSKQNPGASLLVEAADMRRALNKTAKGQGTLSFMGITAPAMIETATTDADEVDAWLAAHDVQDGLFMLSSATPLKTNGEGDCKTPVPGDNFKANLALDTPKPLNELVGISPKQLYSDFEKHQVRETAFEGGGVDRIQIVQYVLRFAASWAGRFTSGASGLANYFNGLPKGQLTTIGLAIYTSRFKIETMLRTLIKWVTAEYFKMEAGPRQRIIAILIKVKSVIAQIAIK